jgi:hypothetical protein
MINQEIIGAAQKTAIIVNELLMSFLDKIYSLPAAPTYRQKKENKSACKTIVIV